MRAYASGASDLSAVSKAPFFEGVMRRVFRHPRRRAVAVEIVVRSKIHGFAEPSNFRILPNMNLANGVLFVI